MKVKKSLEVFVSLVLLMSVSGQAQALDWQNLWSTPGQQAKHRLEGEQYDELIKQAPDASWRGIGEYRKGDYGAAVESFAQQREAASLASSAAGVERAMYNQANAHTLNENYPEAIELFDEILASNPDHADASHNRAIAEQLLEQQQQEQQQEQQNSDGEPQDGEQQDGEQSEGDESAGEKGEQSSSDKQDGEQEQSEQQKSDQQQSDNEPSGPGSSEDSEQSAEAAQSAEEQAEQDEQAARAMQAEQAKNPNNDEAGDETTGEVTATGDMASPDPLTEKEQANEQWLRQIPDDPAGLLQRKLQNRHLTDFPKVKDSVNPW